MTARLYLLTGLIIGALLAGGVQQWRLSKANARLMHARQDLASMTANRNSAVAAAEQCSEQVAQLQVLAAERARAAEDARRAAAAAADERNRRADDILSTPFAYPNDACASADDLLQRWLNGRDK